jgi:acyl dehydratase
MGDDHARAGDDLAALHRTLDSTALVTYAGATWDWHRLHHDDDAARARGLPGPIVDGQMFGGLLIEHALRSMPPGTWPTSLEFRFTAMVFAGDAVTVSGTVTGHDGRRRTISQQITRDDGTVAVTAETTVALPAPAADAP